MSSGLHLQFQTTLGDAYVLERELGGGGMSRVFLALERSLGRKVVVKVILPFDVRLPFRNRSSPDPDRGQRSRAASRRRVGRELAGTS